MKKYMALGAVVAALGAGAAALGQTAAAGGAAAAQSDGGLSVNAGDRRAQRDTGPDRHRTPWRTARPPRSTVTVTPRPWVQSASGDVAANRRATLPGVSVSQSTFTLAPGEERPVDVTLTTAPSAGALYGALEIVGLPADHATRKGVVLGYRLVATIRVLPSTPTREPRGRQRRRRPKGTAVIPVRNTGNTIDQVTGSVTLKGARGSRNRSVQAVRILPGKQVHDPGRQRAPARVLHGRRCGSTSAASGS